MSYQQLTTKECFFIEILLLMGVSFRVIGRELGRAHTTISRESQRNHRSDLYCDVIAVKHYHAQKADMLIHFFNQENHIYI